MFPNEKAQALCDNFDGLLDGSNCSRWVIGLCRDVLCSNLTGDVIPQEIYLGRAQIKRVFQIPRVGEVAGCLVTDGMISRKAEIRLIRDEEVIHEGRISSLKHLKNNVTEVKKDYECGIGLDRFKGIQEGDTIEAFTTEKVAPESL